MLYLKAEDGRVIWEWGWVGWGGDDLGWSGGGVCVGWGWNRGMKQSRAGPLQAVVENVNIISVRWL